MQPKTWHIIVGTTWNKCTPGKFYQSSTGLLQIRNCFQTLDEMGQECTTQQRMMFQPNMVFEGENVSHLFRLKISIKINSNSGTSKEYSQYILLTRHCPFCQVRIQDYSGF